MLKKKKIGVIGAGKMGSVIINGMISRNLISASSVAVSDAVTEQMEALGKTYGIHTTSDNKKLVESSDIIILAVKPQNMAEVLADISETAHQKKLFISIAAGVTTALIEEHLKKGSKVIRVMPNTPALIGEGATAITGGSHATGKDLDIARHIFESVGMTVAVKESLMDAVTGLSGSGPAYCFLIIEALTDAGVSLGLSRDIALKLSVQTILGSAKLCQQTGKHPAELKDMVTSPGGTTIAGLKVLEQGKLRATLMAAVEAAASRSEALGRKK